MNYLVNFQPLQLGFSGQFSAGVNSLWLDGGIPALQPDLLAADLLHHALTEIADDQAGVWQYCALTAASDQS